MREGSKLYSFVLYLLHYYSHPSFNMSTWKLIIALQPSLSLFFSFFFRNWKLKINCVPYFQLCCHGYVFSSQTWIALVAAPTRLFWLWKTDGGLNVADSKIPPVQSLSTYIYFVLFFAWFFFSFTFIYSPNLYQDS